MATGSVVYCCGLGVVVLYGCGPGPGPKKKLVKIGLKIIETGTNRKEVGT